MDRLTYEQLEAEHEEFERALRIRIWNECKRSGQRDAMAYRIINDTIAGLKASAAQAIEARRAETGTGSVEDESAAPKGCAQGEQP